MALVISDCKHDARRPFRGMRRVGFTDHGTILFRCALCFDEFEARRCASYGKTGRCLGVAFEGLDRCRKHLAFAEPVE